MKTEEPGTISSLDWLANPSFTDHPEYPDDTPLFPDAAKGKRSS